MSVKYQILKNTTQAQPRADIQLEHDEIGDVNILINGEMVAFFQGKGELWLVNFDKGDIGPLQKAGIRFDRIEDGDSDYYNIKVMGGAD